MSQHLEVPDTGRVGVAPDPVPAYLRLHYWWAYVHPNAIRLFERAWLVNLILWFNYRRLSEAALTALANPGHEGRLHLGRLPGRSLRIASVYGDLTARLARHSRSGGGCLDVVDVLPIQLENLARELPTDAPVRLIARNAEDLALPDASYDRALLFFLLHTSNPRICAAEHCLRRCGWPAQGERWLWWTMRGRVFGIRRGICGCQCRGCWSRSPMVSGSAT